MRIVVNGKPVESIDGITISTLIEEQKVQTPQYVSVGLNGRILSREEFDKTVVSEGDQVEFLYFMGGGLL